MSGAPPSAVIRNGDLVVRFAAPSGAQRTMHFEGVLDQTDFGDVVGIEILDLRRKLGGAVIPPSPSVGLLRWSYDDEIDAFYVHLSEDSAQMQTIVTGLATIDRDVRLIAVELRVAQ